MFLLQIILTIIFALRNTVLYVCPLFNYIKDKAGPLRGASPSEQISSETVFRRDGFAVSILQKICKMRNTDNQKAAKHAAGLANSEQQISWHFNNVKQLLKQQQEQPLHHSFKQRKFSFSLFSLNFKSLTV